MRCPVLGLDEAGQDVGPRLEVHVEGDAASRVLEGDNGSARQALHHVQDAGREALAEMELLLGVLRSPGEDDVDEPTPR